jgi:hypothetical protein
MSKHIFYVQYIFFFRKSRRLGDNVGGKYGSARHAAHAAHDNIISNFSRTEKFNVFPIFAKSSFFFYKAHAYFTEKFSRHLKSPRNSGYQNDYMKQS